MEPREALARFLHNHGHHLAADEASRIASLAELPTPRPRARTHASQEPLAAVGPATGSPAGTGSASPDVDTTVSPAPLPPVDERPVLRCPLCPDWSTRGQTRGLVIHLNRRHAGDVLGEHGASTFRGLRRGTCANCRGLRAWSGRNCTNCKGNFPILPARATDRIVVPSAPPSQGHLGRRSPREPPRLPRDWADRVCALPSASATHVPARARGRLATAIAESLDALLAGGAGHLLELGRTKLLLAPPPAGITLRAELDARLRLWEDGLGGPARAGRSSGA